MAAISINTVSPRTQYGASLMPSTAVIAAVAAKAGSWKKRGAGGARRRQASQVTTTIHRNETTGGNLDMVIDAPNSVGARPPSRKVSGP